MFNNGSVRKATIHERRCIVCYKMLNVSLVWVLNLKNYNYIGRHTEKEKNVQRAQSNHRKPKSKS